MPDPGATPDAWGIGRELLAWLTALGLGAERLWKWRTDQRRAHQDETDALVRHYIQLVEVYRKENTELRTRVDELEEQVRSLLDTIEDAKG